MGPRRDPSRTLQERTLVMDLLTCPWIFPWYSRLIPYTPSSRKASTHAPPSDPHSNPLLAPNTQYPDGSCPEGE